LDGGAAKREPSRVSGGGTDDPIRGTIPERVGGLLREARDDRTEDVKLMA